ncbi:SLC13 family permease [Rhodococcus sp. NPDC058514]|uniref:SLC13 family permease n=1 Tax=unclassified Rhodococcus (in: high G+C Gram-positive bacteria) TaxID=192944 RepID=UPI003669B7F5
MDPILATILVLIAAIVAFITNRMSPAVVALGVALALYLTGAITFEQTIAGFGDPIVVYLAGLFVISEALDATGVTAWAGQQLTRRVGEKRSSVVVALMLLSALLTALISVNGTVAALVPVGVTLAAGLRQPPSQILIPIAFAAHAGSMLTMLGTPINVLVSELSVEAGARAFGFFEFALVGIPLLVGVVVIVVALGPRLLPHRYAPNAPRNLGDHAETLARDYALAPGSARIGYEDGLIEVVIPPRSQFVGDLVYPGMCTESGDLVVTAVRRGEDRIQRTHLRTGDVLVLRGTWEDLERKAGHPGVLPVDTPDRIRRQSVHLGRRSYVAVAVLAAMCALLAFDVFPPAIVVLLAGAILVGSRVVTMSQVQSSVSLTTLIVVAGMIPLATALQTSGAAEKISTALVSWFGSSSPHLLLASIVLLVLVLGQFLSNLATVLIVAPVAVAVAESAHVSILPMMMGITVAGAASFLTPVATPGNLMVQGPGDYRFGDYWKLGLPCAALFVCVAVFLVPLIWPF